MMNRVERLFVFVVLWATYSAAPASARADDESLFQPAVRLMADYQVIDTGEATGHSGPCLADVDGDGARDLVVGDFSGRFRFYRNTGTDRKPRYAAHTYLEAGGVVAEVPIY